jgi:trehalose utilization protein
MRMNATQHYAAGERRLKEADRAFPLSYDSAVASAAIASAHFAAAQAAAMLGIRTAPDSPPELKAEPTARGFSFRDNGGLGDD